MTRKGTFKCKPSGKRNTVSLFQFSSIVVKINACVLKIIYLDNCFEATAVTNVIEIFHTTIVGPELQLETASSVVGKTISRDFAAGARHRASRRRCSSR